jgi:hypothetical protein
MVRGAFQLCRRVASTGNENRPKAEVGEFLSWHIGNDLARQRGLGLHLSNRVIFIADSAAPSTPGLKYNHATALHIHVKTENNQTKLYHDHRNL